MNDRIDKLDDRIKMLIDKYPLVFWALLGAGLLIGFVLGALLF